MLPFLRKDYKNTGVIVSKRKPDDIDGNKLEEPDDNQSLKACMLDFAKSAKADDHAGMATAFRAAFQSLEKQPHDEVEHDTNSYDDQNSKAASND